MKACQQALVNNALTQERVGHRPEISNATQHIAVHPVGTGKKQLLFGALAK